MQHEDPRLLGRNLPASTFDDLTIRRADLRPGSFDEAAMTVEATISTYADVRRRDPRGPFIERLDRAGLDTRNLIGAPVLDGHRNSSGTHVVGVVSGLRHEDGRLVAVIRMSAADDARPIITRIREGVLRGVSVGYRVNKWSESTDPATGERIRTALAWTIHEVSVVPIPADPGATIRSSDMPEATETTTEETRQPPPDTAERQRRTQIRELARRSGLSTEWADQQIDADADMTAVRAAAFDEMQRRSAPTIRAHVGVSHDDPAAIRTRRADALACRMLGTTPHADAREFMSDRIVDHAAGCLELAGVRTRGMSPETIFQRAFAPHTTSDFPLLMGTATNRVLLDAYEAAGSPLKAIGRQATHPDFKGRTLVRVGEMSRLQRVTEVGEIRHMTRAESGTIYSLETYAGIISYSRKLMLNDDLGGLADQTTAQGQAAAQTEAEVLSDLLLEAGGQGPLMYDNVRLFHASHGNLGTAAALSVESLSDARLAMRQQTGQDGTTRITVVPRWLVVGPENETLAEQLLATLNATAVADVNPFSQKLQLLVEPRITDGSWYVFAASPVSLEFAFLASAPGPQLATRQGWDVLGMEFRVLEDFGAGFVDWRAAYRNPGV